MLLIYLRSNVNHLAISPTNNTVCDIFHVGAESAVSVWVERGTVDFPQSADVPVIMVGPGTGCAPFRSLIHDRTSQEIPCQEKPGHSLPTLCFSVCFMWYFAFLSMDCILTANPTDVTQIPWMT